MAATTLARYNMKNARKKCGDAGRISFLSVLVSAADGETQFLFVIKWGYEARDESVLTDLTI